MICQWTSLRSNNWSAHLWQITIFCSTSSNLFLKLWGVTRYLLPEKISLTLFLFQVLLRVVLSWRWQLSFSCSFPSLRFMCSRRSCSLRLLGETVDWLKNYARFSLAEYGRSKTMRICFWRVFVIMKTKVFENALVLDSDLSGDPLLIVNMVFVIWPTFRALFSF